MPNSSHQFGQSDGCQSNKPRLARPWNQRAEHYDVIVVGSGYGGGVAAARLARAGKRVAVLERGREYAPGEFPNRFSDLKNQLRISSAGKSVGPSAALYDVRVGTDMHVMVGCGLGGGSLVNAGVALRPDARVFDDTIWPEALRCDGLLDQGFQRAAHWIRPARHPGASRMSKYKALEAAGDHLGHGIIDSPLTVSFEDTVNPAGVTQPACTLCGDCCGGCNVGAKNTVAQTYLSEAERHGADMFTEISVHHIEKQSCGTWSVITQQDGQDGAPERLEADVVMLCAGTLGSTEILLRSATQGLACSSQIGQRFSANGDVIAFGYGAKTTVNAIGVGHPSKLDEHQVGAVVSGHIEFNDSNKLENSVCVLEGVIPSALAPLLPVLFLPDGRLLGALKSLIKGVYKGPFACLQTFFAVSHDSAKGWFTLENDRICLNWPGAKDDPVYAKVDAVLSDIVAHSGGDYVKHPLSETIAGNKPSTAHPLGGCAMSEDAAHGVVNHKSQVFDTAHGESTINVHKGLYVVDGSIIPRSLGVNPLFTITALSERALLHFAKDYNLPCEAFVAAISKPRR